MTEQDLTPKSKQEVKSTEKTTEQTRPGRYFLPDVDIAEDEDGLWLWADLPGVDKNSLSIDLSDDVLTLQGDVSLKDYDGLQPVYTEYNVGHFQRRFALPDAGRWDRDKISARLADGVLELRLPKAERAKPRRIDVTA